MIPFTTDQFLDVFRQYNLAVWPAQLALYALALTAVALALLRTGNSSKGVSLILSLLWVWMGLVYHASFFTAINKAAWLFAIAFVFQGFVFIYFGVANDRLRFRFRGNLFCVVGGILLLFSLLIYQALGHWLGQRYPAAPTFGVPCPTTIFTFGLLLWTDRKVPALLLVLPVVWTLIGFSAALFLGITQDYGLLASSVISLLLLILREQGALQQAKRSFAASMVRF